MISRRSALAIVAALVTRTQAQPLQKASPCRLPERLVLDFGSGACTVKTIRVQQGAVWADVPVGDLLTALGAKTGGD
jgi:hypothetical protein